MSFSAELWQAITPIYAAILDHPFVRGLTDGSLSREAFRFYAVQDALYLRDFARDGLVNVVGGCCGTTPEFIAGLRRTLASGAPEADSLEDAS